MMNKKYLTFLSENKLKNTAQRTELFELVFREESHFSVDSLQQKTQGKIGMATLYRFLRLLVHSNILNEYNFGKKTLFERIDQDHHDHIICEKCGEIEEFYSEEIETIQTDIMKKIGFTLTHHRHELYGFCKQCREKPVFE